MMRPGKGDFPVGQLDAQNLFPNGRGMPSLASSIRIRVSSDDGLLKWLPTLNDPGGGECLSPTISINVTIKGTGTYSSDDVLK